MLLLCDQLMPSLVVMWTLWAVFIAITDSRRCEKLVVPCLIMILQFLGFGISAL